MSNTEHVQRLMQGTEQWNTWRAEHPEIRPDLQGAGLIGADLSNANLIDADLRTAKLTRADLTRADLTRADLVGAKLIEAKLIEAKLIGADLSYADLSYATLSYAALSYANLSNADLSYADLSYANLLQTSIAKVDLRTVTGLTTINYLGPSHIELFSVQLPQDGSALHFLRSVGVPDEWIDDYRARMMHPIQYHSCFISYTSKDEALAKRLHADLQAEGVRCWFAPEDKKIGNKIRQRIDEAIHLQDKLLLILSRGSVASDWVEYEIETALARERKQQREILFPVRIDKSIVKADQAWAKHLYGTRHIGDFTQWRDPDAYQVAFTRLLRDLKQEG